MVITIWKDSKTIKVDSITTTKGVGQVTNSKGRNSITVKLAKYIITYQKNMVGFDRRDQQRLMGEGFANVSHFKNWYKKVFFGIAGFNFLYGFMA